MAIPLALRDACHVLRARFRLQAAGLRFPGDSINDPSRTPEIREATRLYFETWAIPILDAIEVGDWREVRRLTQFERKDAKPSEFSEVRPLVERD